MYELDDEEFERLMARVDRMTPVQLLRLQCKVEAMTRSNDEVPVQPEEPFDERDTVESYLLDLFDDDE